MTQPDGFLPERAFNYSSIAALAAMSEEDIEDQLKGDVSNPFLDFLDGLRLIWNGFWNGIFGTAETNKTGSSVALAAAAVAATAGTADTNASASITIAAEYAIAIYNGWFGSGGDGTPEQVQAAVEAIKTRCDDISARSDDLEARIEALEAP